jgi:hypothetical protein
VADHPDYFDHFGYGKIKHERLLRREANKAAWAASVETRRLEQHVGSARRRGGRPRGGSCTWSDFMRLANQRGWSEDDARSARARHMPYWQPGDPIPMKLIRAIMEECMRKCGERKLRKLGLR